MKIKHMIYMGLSSLLLLAGSGCTDLDEKWYKEVTPENYYTSKEAVEAVVARSFTHVRWYIVNDRWRLQELTADGFAVATKGSHWYNGGTHRRMIEHKWTPDDGMISDTWRGGTMGIALAMESKEDLDEYVNYESLGMTQSDKENHTSQLETAIAYLYMRNLDFFGGMPIFTSTKQEDVPRSTAQETFDHIEDLLTASIPKLKKKANLGDAEDGFFTQGSGAAILAQLYFNAEAYVGKPMYDKAAKISKDIIEGVYGPYELDQTWNGIHGFNNGKSPEMLWAIPSEYAKLQYDWFWSYFYHYESYKYFDSDRGADNGCHLQPSRKPTGEIYSEADFKLGRPYESFHVKDLRRKPFLYHGSEKYEGMFLAGNQTNPVTGVSSLGTQEYKGKVINFVDQVARFSDVGKEGKPASIAQLTSDIDQGEENSGIRIVKVPQPNLADKKIRWNADQPAIRLAEIYYMYAECLLRDGKAGEAAVLINKVRSRNFENRVDPDPVTAANLDSEGFRMVKEWQVEFLGEGRRRTDLIRWNMFVNQSWWNHKPSKDKTKNRFPVPTSALSGSNLLEQNEGYE